MLERGLLLRLRFAFDHHVNLRPARLYPGVPSPAGRRAGDIDFVVVREGTEGPYVGNGGVVRQGTPHEIATEVSINTAYGVERVVRDAFAPRRSRGRASTSRWCTRPTCSSTPAACGRARSPRSAADFPDVTTDYLHVDAATIFMVTQPERFDVIVTDNLFGDILTDLAAAVTGGIGLAASGNLDVSGTQPVDVRAGARLRTGHRRAGASPTRPRRSCRWRCCSSTSAYGDAADRASRRRSRPTWPRRARRPAYHRARSATPSIGRGRRLSRPRRPFGVRATVASTACSVRGTVRR